jgi:hypothetical protein
MPPGIPADLITRVATIGVVHCGHAFPCWIESLSLPRLDRAVLLSFPPDAMMKTSKENQPLIILDSVAFVQQFLKLCRGVDIRKHTRIVHGDLDDSSRIFPDNRVPALIRTQTENLMKQIGRKKDRMAPATIVNGNYDGARP